MVLESNERSPFWGIGATGAIAGSAAYAYTQNKNAILDALRSNVGGVRESVIAAVANAPSYNLAGRATRDFVENAVLENINNISRLYTPDIAKKEIFYSAYESLLGTGRITPENALSKLAGITGQSSVIGAYGVAKEAVQAAGGDISFGRNIPSNIGLLSEEFIPSPGGFAARSLPGLTAGELSAEAYARAEAIRGNISKAAGEQFGGLIGDYRYLGSAENPLMATKIMGQEYKIPLTAATSMQIGSANYALRQAYGPGGNLMSYGQMVENAIVESLQSSATTTKLRQQLHQVDQRVAQNMFDVASDHMAGAVWMPPSQAMTSGGLAASRLRNIEAIAYGVEDEEIKSLIGRGLYPYTSPSSAGKGTLLTQDIGKALYGDLGLFISPEQRPTQFIRGEWGATGFAKTAALQNRFRGLLGKYYNRLERKGVTETYRDLLYGGISATAEGAYSVPQLMTFYAKPGEDIGFARQGLNTLMAEEEGVLSRSAAAMMEHERSLTKRIALNAGLEANKDIITALQGQPLGQFVPLEITGGRGLGVDIETGKRLQLDLSQRVVGAQLAGENQAILHMKETIRPTEGAMLKTFSEEQKALVGARSDSEWRQVLKAAGIKSRIAGQDIEQVLYGKIVQRNKMALITQQMEAMSVFAAAKVNRSSVVNASARNRDILTFLEDPAKYSNVSGLMAQHEADAHIAIQRNLTGIAQRFRFTPEEMAMTFGLADEPALGLLTNAELSAVKASGGVIGLGKGFVGDLVSGNWGRGSFEHSGFRLLAMKGQLGVDYSAELSKRIAGTGELGALSKMEASALNQEGLWAKLNRSNLPSILEGDLIQEEGRVVGLGRGVKAFGGSDVLYIPGTLEAPTTMQEIVARGKVVQKPLARELSYFRSLIDRGATDTELEEAATGLRRAIVRATEEQGAARGKIIGSRQLTAVQRGSDNVLGLAAEDINKMYDDLMARTSDLDQLAELKAQREALFSKETVAAGLWRHPTTGPESFQFTNIRLDPSLARGTVGVPYQEGEMTIGGVSRKINVSQMVGLKGDYDRDQLVIAAISNRDTQKRAASHIAHQANAEYASYLFNHYTMKDAMENAASTKEVLQMRTPEALQAGFEKLTTAKVKTGQINLALQQFKIGVAYGKSDKYRPLAEMFFHLEEAAIGGKHGIIGEELYQAIGQAGQLRGETGTRTMEQVLTNVFGTQNLSAAGTISDQFGKYNVSTSLNMREAAQYMIEAKEAVAEDVKMALEAASIAKGKSTRDFTLGQDIMRMYSRRKGSIDVAGAMMQAGSTDMMDIASRGSRLTEGLKGRASGALKAFTRNKRALAIGAAAAAGIMFMAPSTSGVIRPVQTATAGGANLSEEDISPEGFMQMNPPPPRPNRSPRNYEVSGGRPTTHANIKLHMEDLDSSSRDFMSHAQQLGGRVNITSIDNRHVTDPVLLASKIHERL